MSGGVLHARDDPDNAPAEMHHAFTVGVERARGQCDRMGMSHPRQTLSEQIEHLVREHIEATRRAAAQAVERAFASSSSSSSSPRPVAQRATRRAPGPRRGPNEIAALGAQLYAAVVAAPGETMAVLAPATGATPGELHRPMILQASTIRFPRRARSMRGSGLNQLNTQRKLPQQARAKATVEAILQATIQVLIDDSYARMTTTRVAERAGVSVGTLYQYFPDKESLVRTLTADHEAAMLGELAGAAAQSAGQPLAPRVQALLAALLRAKAADGLLGPALAMTMLNLDGRTALARALDQSRQLLIPLLREHAHEIPHLDPVQAANTTWRPRCSPRATSPTASASRWRGPT